MNSKNKFVHIRNYTQYSLSKGAIKIGDLIKKCVDQKLPAVAISDFDNLFGCMEFSLECHLNGIQPIIGCNIFLKTDNYEPGYVLLICKTENGFKNLSKLVTISNLENAKNSRAFVTFSDLKKYSDGLISLAGGQFGILTNNFFQRNNSDAKKIVKSLSDIYKDNFFLEIQRLSKFNNDYENFLLSLSGKLNIPVVATNENFFLSKNFYSSHDALLSISEQKYLDSENRSKSSVDFHFKTSEEMYSLYADIPFVCENSILIAKKISFFLEEKQPSLPKVDFEINEDELLKKNSISGLQKRINLENLDQSENKRIYLERLEYELSVIIKMGYSSYFIIVSDFINWAKDNNIPVGPGRGSGAGSLVAWALQITDLDPIRFGLLFERFLNPDRVSLPDFDIDFCMDKRDEVIKYVQQKYGELNVAQIITFGSFQARAAIRDVGRVMQLPLPQVDEICKMIPYNPAQPISLNESIKERNIQKLINKDANIKKLFEISLNLEGLYRHASTHAAGIVISDKPLQEIVPLYKDPKSEIPVTQFSMKYVEKIGLIKFDFLGLKTLTVISEACKYLNERSIDVKIDQIPLDDFETYKLLKNGDTTGIFQLEGQGMRETLKKVIPDRFEDIIAVVSLYRPGPMDNIPTYINRKQKKESYNYLHPSLKNILEETYGIMVYQEQVMLIAQKIAGFSLAKADLLRRAMGKKIKSEMVAQRSNFIEGCRKNNLKDEESIKLFSEIEKFAGYGFNKSHAAAYAKIAYQTAYLKANYPLEFLCSLMNCDIGNFDKISSYCSEVKKLGFKIFNPDVNNSFAFFKVIYSKLNQPLGISFGLSAIKNIGENSTIFIVKEREKNGNFSSLVDFLKRINNKYLNKKILESLIFSGSLSSIENNQNYLLKNIDKLLKFNVNSHKMINKNQNNLFSESLDYKEFDSSSFKFFGVNKKLEMEYESFGFYLTDHPTKFYKSFFKSQNNHSLNNLQKLISSNCEDMTFNSICLISNLNFRNSRTGKKFCFLTLSDDTGSLDTICFSEFLDSINFELKVGSIISVKLILQKMKETKKYVVASATCFDESYLNDYTYSIYLDPYKLDHQNLKKILKNDDNGKSEFLFYTYVNDHEIKIKSAMKYNVSIDFLSSLKSVNGILDIKKN